MKGFSFVRRNRFVLLLLFLFLLCETAIRYWDPMTYSLRFYKNDFVKTLYHHDWQRSGPIFFGNSAVTGSYQEKKAQAPIMEMGLSYGKITDLVAILQDEHFHVTDRLVIGIDVHTMLDKLMTDPTYPWFRHLWQPYVYEYRDYFRQVLEKTARSTWTGIVERDRQKLFTLEPAWNDKELYFGRNTLEKNSQDLARYDKLFNWMAMPDFQRNLDALDWVVAYAQRNGLPLHVIWMPYNPAYPKPPYWAGLKQAVQARLDSANIPTLDVVDRFEPSEFHDLVHLNQETGAPRFTKEVDAWVGSFAKR